MNNGHDEMNDAHVPTSGTVQHVLGICSYLLSYPDEMFQQSLAEIEHEIAQLPAHKMTASLQTFCTEAEKLPLPALIDTYVYTFDFGKKTNLYVTYMTSGEQRERGQDLLYLKSHYKQHGFSATDAELPDYLPLMLEFAGQVETAAFQPIFAKYYANVREISDNLHAQNNVYRHVLAAIVSALHEVGITDH